MTKKLFCIYDAKSAVYPHPPFLANQVGEALRSFMDIVNDGKSALALHPEDYDMYELGSFNMETGLISAHSVPKLTAKGLEMVNAQKTH